MTSTRRNSFSLIAVLATAASSRGCSLGDISNVDGRGHFQRGSTATISRGRLRNRPERVYAFVRPARRRGGLALRFVERISSIVCNFQPQFSFLASEEAS